MKTTWKQNFLLICLWSGALTVPVRSQTISWIRQFGTAGIDHAYAVAVDTTGIYVVGGVWNTLPGSTGAADTRAFVRKYDASGNLLWNRPFETSSLAGGVTVDATGVYVVGGTSSALSGQTGQTRAGAGDAFVRKYDTGGNELWTRQFGTSSADRAWGVVADATAVYVVGVTFGALPGQTYAGYGDDAFVRKYDTNGIELWTRQFGTSTWDYASGVEADATGIYVVGGTLGALPGQTYAGDSDAFVRKYNTNGIELWTHQFGTSTYDSATGVEADASGIYMAGTTSGTLPGQTRAGDSDAFVRKYDTGGNELWTRQFGTSSGDVALDVAVGANGIYVVGMTLGALPGQTRAGESDDYVRKYDTSGNVLWTRQFGSSSYDVADDVAVDTNGIYVVGGTWGALPGQTYAGGWDDAFVVRITEVIPIAIDIKPGSFTNIINPKSRGNIPVAILSSSTFNAFAKVDITSLTFGSTGNENSLVFCNGSPGNVHGDGLQDLLCHFETQKTGFQAGDTQGVLKGKTLDGMSLQGTDSVRIVP